MVLEDDPLAEAADGTEPDEGASAGGFGDEEPGVEHDLHAAGVLPNPGAAPLVSREDALAYLDDFVARLDARMAAVNTPLPTAADSAAVIAEVTANVDAAAAGAPFSSDEERRTRRKMRRRTRRTRRKTSRAKERRQQAEE